MKKILLPTVIDPVGRPRLLYAVATAYEQVLGQLKSTPLAVVALRLRYFYLH